MLAYAEIALEPFSGLGMDDIGLCCAPSCSPSRQLLNLDTCLHCRGQTAWLPALHNVDKRCLGLCAPRPARTAFFDASRLPTLRASLCRALTAILEPSTTSASRAEPRPSAERPHAPCRGSPAGFQVLRADLFLAPSLHLAQSDGEAVDRDASYRILSSQAERKGMRSQKKKSAANEDGGRCVVASGRRSPRAELAWRVVSAVTTGRPTSIYANSCPYEQLLDVRSAESATESA